MKLDYSSSSYPAFSIHDGLTLQSRDLAQWKKVLTAEAYAFVFAETTKNNTNAKDGYDILRGNSIHEIIGNFMSKA